MSAPSKIAIRVNNWIGDVVMSLAAIEQIRAQHPNAEIVAIARPWVQDLLAFRPDLIDRCIAYDDKGEMKGARGLWRISRQLRAERFDRIFVFTKHLKGAAMAWLAGIPIRAGLATPETRLFLNRGLPFRSLPKSGRHQSWNYLDAAAHAGVPVDAGAKPRLHELPELRERVQTRFLQDAPRPLLAVHAGAAYGTAKRWEPDRYAEICRRHAATTGGSVVLLGVASEADVNQRIAELAGDGILNLCGKTRLDESIAMIGQCDIFLSNDSGLMHVAAAFGKPQVAVFGPTDAEATFPLNPAARVVRHPVSCSPCFQRHCPIGHDCMRGVSTDAVWQALPKTETAR